MADYIIRVNTPVEALREVIAWHRYQAALCIDRAHSIAAKTKTRQNLVAKASHHNFSADFIAAIQAEPLS